jgi:hypothetical protein
MDGNAIGRGCPRSEWMVRDEPSRAPKNSHNLCQTQTLKLQRLELVPAYRAFTLS